ncbi:MAG: hypothetical protein ABSC71_20460 [Candidatus Acidiferrales bacterium]|jgi:hypothetical protein
MSTRSVIARAGKAEGTFVGVYIHWGGSPSERGPELWKTIRENFHGDLRAALAHLIDQHPAGWSDLPSGSCYCHPRKSSRPEFRTRKAEPANAFTDQDVKRGETDLEFAYIFDEEQNRLYVRDIRHDAEAIIELADDSPDWTTAECGLELERCSHYAWYHGLLPKTSSLSTQAWLGNRPLEFRDAVGFIIGGKRYRATGSGGNSDYFNRTLSRAPFPSGSWIASVQARNGRRLDLPVATITGQTCAPFPGVTWILPPTKSNPHETLVSA